MKERKKEAAVPVAAESHVQMELPKRENITLGEISGDYEKEN